MLSTQTEEMKGQVLIWIKQLSRMICFGFHFVFYLVLFCLELLSSILFGIARFDSQ